MFLNYGTQFETEAVNHNKFHKLSSTFYILIQLCSFLIHESLLKLTCIINFWLSTQHVDIIILLHWHYLSTIVPSWLWIDFKISVTIAYLTYRVIFYLSILLVHLKQFNFWVRPLLAFLFMFSNLLIQSSFHVLFPISVYVPIFVCSYALVHVEIKNQGEDAFKPETFGDLIIIERRISESTSSTVLKDHQGFSRSLFSFLSPMFLNLFSFFLSASVCFLLS